MGLGDRILATVSLRAEAQPISKHVQDVRVVRRLTLLTRRWPVDFLEFDCIYPLPHGTRGQRAHFLPHLMLMDCAINGQI